MQIRITVANQSNQVQKFIFFSAPLICPQVDEVATICLYATTLAPFKRSGATANLVLELPFQAGVREETPFGSVCASRALSLASADDKGVDQFDLSVAPLGLSLQTHVKSPFAPTFRFSTPIYNDAARYFLGGALTSDTGATVLPSFIVARPNQKFDIEMVPSFFVQTGVAKVGGLVDFHEQALGAARCDATAGSMHFLVEYSSWGTWSVNPR